MKQIEELQTAGMTLKEIAEQTGLKTTQCYHILNKENLPYKKGLAGKPKKVDFPEFEPVYNYLSEVEFTTITILNDRFPEISYHKINTYFKDHVKVLGKVDYKNYILRKYVNIDALSSQTGCSKKEIVNHLKSIL